MAGPAVRTDIVAVYPFRRAGDGVELLQLRRSGREALGGTWQPVMGHVREGERASEAALRELGEEAGFGVGHVIGMWQLELPEVYFMQAWEAVVMSPGFAVEVGPKVEPTVGPEHDGARWVRVEEAGQAFLWPGQRAAVEQIVRDILASGSQVERWLRVDLGRAGD